MKTIYYEKLDRMDPREGVSYATTYVKQTAKQRHELEQHIARVINEIGRAVPILTKKDTTWIDFIEKPLKGFKTTKGQNRCLVDLLSDMKTESAGKQRNGQPKDFALAPIERWNKLFKGTDYEIDLVKSTDKIQFSRVMELV